MLPYIFEVEELENKEGNDVSLARDLESNCEIHNCEKPFACPDCNKTIKRHYSKIHTAWFGGTVRLF